MLKIQTRKTWKWEERLVSIEKHAIPNGTGPDVRESKPTDAIFVDVKPLGIKFNDKAILRL